MSIKERAGEKAKVWRSRWSTETHSRPVDRRKKLNSRRCLEILLSNKKHRFAWIVTNTNEGTSSEYLHVRAEFFASFKKGPGSVRRTLIDSTGRGASAAYQRLRPSILVKRETMQNEWKIGDHVNTGRKARRVVLLALKIVKVRS